MDVVPILNNAIVNDFEERTELAPVEAFVNIRNAIRFTTRPAGRRKTPALKTGPKARSSTMKIVKVVIFILIAVVAITLFWTINRKSATLNVSEAFFRYQFKNNLSSLRGQNTMASFLSEGKAYFLEVEGKDPSPKLLARFKGHSPPVKKRSEFVGHSTGSRLRKKDGSVDEVIEGTDSNGIVFRINSYKWYGNIVVITGGYYEGNLSASSSAYTYIQIAGMWFLIYALPPVIA